MFQQVKTMDVLGEIIAAARQQDALFRQRFDERGQIGDVFSMRGADADKRRLGDGGACAVAGEQFAQKRAVLPAG